MEAAADSVAAVRAFNRFYTRLIGVLAEGLLDTPYSLTEARVIFELAQQDATELADLRRLLELDAGYLSRIVARLERKGLAATRRSDADRRRSVIRLTGKGRAAFRMLDQRSAAEVRGILEPLSKPDRQKLTGAMRAIRDILEPSRVPHPFVLRAPGPGDFGWIVQRHGALYALQYGWDETFEALVARIVADYLEHRDAEREAAWIAEVDGDAAGCVLCTKKEENLAQLRLLLVEPSHRHMGIGARLVEECIRFARRARYERIMLWTNDVLEDARRIYERAGFELVESDRHHSFGRELVGQNWLLTL